jgi:creatinine amidohydrolase
MARLADMTWEEVRDLDVARTVAILPVGATEAHGPHLPLATDVVISEAMAEAGSEALAARGVPAVILPPLAYTAAPFAAEFPGTLHVSPEAVTALIRDIARSLGRQGFRTLAIANTHLDPAHLASIAVAVEVSAREGLPRIVAPDLTRNPWASRLGEEFRTGACHAGRYETSVLMSARVDLVREKTRRELPANPASLSDAIRAGRSTFVEAGGPRAYFGWPADASAAEGRETIGILGEILAEAVSGPLGSGARPAAP